MATELEAGLWGPGCRRPLCPPPAPFCFAASTCSRFSLRFFLVSLSFCLAFSPSVTHTVFSLSPKMALSREGSSLVAALPALISPLKEALLFPTVTGFSFRSENLSFPGCLFLMSLVGGLSRVSWRSCFLGCWRRGCCGEGWGGCASHKPGGVCSLQSGGWSR